MVDMDSASKVSILTFRTLAFPARGRSEWKTLCVFRVFASGWVLMFDFHEQADESRQATPTIARRWKVKK
jgi:hypothetical protein